MPPICKKNSTSVKHNKVKHNEMRYVCTNDIMKWSMGLSMCVNYNKETFSNPHLYSLLVITFSMIFPQLLSLEDRDCVTSTEHGTSPAQKSTQNLCPQSGSLVYHPNSVLLTCSTYCRETGTPDQAPESHSQTASDHGNPVAKCPEPTPHSSYTS